MEADVNMKRFLMAAALIFCLMFGQAQAADVYATTENKNGKITDVYVTVNPNGKAVIMEENYGFKVILHSIGRNHRMNKYWKLGFIVKNGDLYVLLNLGASNVTREQVTSGNTVLLSYYWDIYKTTMKHK